jgi:hypothetical protein
MQHHQIENIYTFIDGRVYESVNKYSPFTRKSEIIGMPLATGVYQESDVMYYYEQGLLHNEEGPAIKHLLLDYCEYYYKGKEIQCSSTEEFQRIIKLIVFT